MFQGRVYQLQTEKIISAMSWPKMSVSGLIQAPILVPAPVLAVQKLKKRRFFWKKIIKLAFFKW